MPPLPAPTMTMSVSQVSVMAALVDVGLSAQPVVLVAGGQLDRGDTASPLAWA